MSEVEIRGQVYQCTKLATPVQWHVYRRLLPVFQGLTPLWSMTQMIRGANGEMAPDMSGIPIMAAMAALANTIGALGDTDADYVKDACLDAARWNQGGRWMPVRAPGGAFLCGAADAFDVQLRLVWEVLQESLGNFSAEIAFPFLMTPSNGVDQTEAPPTMSSDSPLMRNFSGAP